MKTPGCEYLVRTEAGKLEACGTRATFRALKTSRPIHYCEAHGHYVSHLGNNRIEVARIAPAPERPATSRD